MRIRTSTFRWIIAMLLIFVVLCGGFTAAYSYTVRQYKMSYQEQLDERDGILDSRRRMAYVAMVDLKAGDAINETNVYYQEVFSTLGQESFFDSSSTLDSQTALVDIPAGMYITRNMLAEFSDEQEGYREVQYSEFKVTPNISVNDYCDIRIAYPNGETYVVLAKKKLVRVGENMQDCCLWVSPEEIDRMQSCIVDAYGYDGTTIFLTKYIEPNVQEASKVSYTPSLQVIGLIKNDPNIIEIASDFLSNKVRMELENRVTEGMLLNNSKEWSEDEISRADQPGSGDDMDTGTQRLDDRYFFNEDAGQDGGISNE